MTIAYEYRPGVLYLNVTNRCSNDCTFCVRRQPGYSLAGFDMRLSREPGADGVLAAISRLEDTRRRPFQQVVFCGFGEPTYRLDIIDRVGTELRARGTRVRLNTNGQAALISGADPFPRLRDAVDAVSVSLNAPDAESYVSLCQPRFGPAAYSALLEFARRSVEVFDEVVLSVVGFSVSAEDVAACRRKAREIGADLRVR